jgi:hypothetical protein
MQANYTRSWLVAERNLIILAVSRESKVVSTNDVASSSAVYIHTTRYMFAGEYPIMMMWVICLIVSRFCGLVNSIHILLGYKVMDMHVISCCSHNQ